MFQYRTLIEGNMVYRTYMGRAIGNMRNIIIWHKKSIISEGVDEEGHIKAENRSFLVVQIPSIFAKIGVDKMDKLLKNILDTDMIVNKIQRL